MVKQAALVVEPKQQRSDQFSAFAIPKPTNDAVCTTIILDLLHASAIVGAILDVQSLGHNAIKHCSSTC